MKLVTDKTPYLDGCGEKGSRIDGSGIYNDGGSRKRFIRLAHEKSSTGKTVSPKYVRQEFLRNKKFEEKRLEREKHIFDMEWKMLEDGWRKLAAEREQLERVYSGFNNDEERISFSNVSASVFFSGVNNMRSLKKRYKDLIKIFHPDNAEGDTDVIQKINEEYEVLRKRIGMDK